MLEAAVKAAETQAKALNVPRPLIVGVTVLTSTARDGNLEKTVLERARLARESGLDGVVASVEEAGAIRRELGQDFLIVTPGIRPWMPPWTTRSVSPRLRWPLRKAAIFWW